MNKVTISALTRFPDQLEAYFYSIPQSFWLWAPESWEGIPSESLNALEQICHIRDVEIEGYHIRFRRLLEENEPVLESLDGYALVKEKNYIEADPKKVFKAFRSARKQTLTLINDLTVDQLSRAGHFEGYGRLTTKGLIHYLSSHDHQHLSGLQWLQGKIN